MGIRSQGHPKLDNPYNYRSGSSGLLIDLRGIIIILFTIFINHDADPDNPANL